MLCTPEVGSGDGVPKVEGELVDELASDSPGGKTSIDEVGDVEEGGGLRSERKVGCQD